VSVVFRVCVTPLIWLYSVNEIFSPARVDSTYSCHPTRRATALKEDKGTNYGVVRLNLLEHIYETLYLQRVRYGNSSVAEKHWPHRILPYRCVTNVEESPVAKGGIRLYVQDRSPLYLSEVPGAQERSETLDVDAVFVATGYHRDLHETLLKDARHLMPGGDLKDAKWQVGRDYKMRFEDKKVGDDAGVWLQGCCESTHGVSHLSVPFGHLPWPPWGTVVNSVFVLIFLTVE
jgi:L-ornithine N5-oxygenase